MAKCNQLASLPFKGLTLTTLPCGIVDLPLQPVLRSPGGLAPLEVFLPCVSQGKVGVECECALHNTTNKPP